MFLLGIVTIALLLTSHALNRLRTAEALLLMPFAAGAVLLPLLGAVPFLELRIGHLVLALFLSFEWLLLTGMGLLYQTLQHRAPRPARNPLLRDWGPTLNWFAIFVIVVLVLYTVGVMSQVIAAPSMSDYFLEKRAQAHAGEGVDVANPVAYRAINFSMALVLLMSSWRYFARNENVPHGRGTFLVLLLIGSVASILEGNRSTLIVTLIALMCFAYVNRMVTAKAMSISLTVFVLLFVLSMQVLRLEGDFSLEGIQVAFSWFSLYAFGSLASFADFFDQRIATFWYTFDVGAYKFGEAFAQSIGARELFIIDYVDVGSLSTNVYSGYAVLYDYLGAWSVAFLVVKNAVFYGFKWASQRSFVGNACYIALLSSYPLTIYHEFMLTTLYYCLNIFELAIVMWLLVGLARLVRQGSSSRIHHGAAQLRRH
ncbi:MAG: hypothetical protein ABIQ60_16810 [Burkholderiaceae bacterium]